MASKEPIEVVMYQNRRLPTTKGHVIRFKKGEPRTIPPECLEEAMRFGAVPTSEQNVPQEEEQIEPEQPTTVEERRELIQEGIRILEGRQGREDFNASGSPNVKKLEEETGLRDIQAAERDAAYDMLKQERGEGNDD